jgi:hypothetical protein
MSHKRLSYNATEKYTTPSNHNLLYLWGTTGSEWTSTIAEECLAATNQPMEKEKSFSSRGIVLLGIIATLSLLGAATLTQAPVASWMPQQNAESASAR